MRILKPWTQITVTLPKTPGAIGGLTIPVKPE